MNDPIRNLEGIGPIKEKTFHACKIVTVGDLAKIVPGHSPVIVDNLGVLISRAKNYLKMKTEETAPTTVMRVTGQGAELQSLIAVKPETKKGSRVLIEQHSWMDKRVVVPDQNSANIMRQAVVYEICLDSDDRVSMLCEWIGEDDDSEIVMTYSPQLIFHFNPQLAALVCEIDPSDWESMAKKHILKNVIWETNAMRREDFGVTEKTNAV